MFEDSTPIQNNEPSSKKLMRPKRLKYKRTIPLGEFLALEFDTEQQLLGAVFTEASTGMISAARGLGKTLLAMVIAYCIAGKKKLLPWGQGAGVVVTYLDGEMHGQLLHKRLTQLANRDPEEVTKQRAKENLQILSRDMFGDIIGYVDDEVGQQAIEAYLQTDCKLLIIDNLSAWTSSGREDGAAFAPIKRWLGRLRAKGIAVLLIHHTGKNGSTQRGTSIHEDMLDYSILLTEDKSGKPKNGTSFHLTHTKLRDLHPELPQTCRFVFTSENNILNFQYENTETALNDKEEKVLKMRAEGKDGKTIANELGVDPSTISRTLKRAQKKQITDEPPSDAEA